MSGIFNILIFALSLLLVFKTNSRFAHILMSFYLLILNAAR